MSSVLSVRIPKTLHNQVRELAEIVLPSTLN